MENDCVVCMNSITNKHVLTCGHDMCSGCFSTWKSTCVKEGSDVTCPCCRHVIEKRVDIGNRDDMLIQLSYEDYERVVYGEEPSPYVGLELVDMGGNPTWRELLALQTNPFDNEEYIDYNDELISYDDRNLNTEYDSDSDESFIDYPDDEDCEW